MQLKDLLDDGPAAPSTPRGRDAKASHPPDPPSRRLLIVLAACFVLVIGITLYNVYLGLAVLGVTLVVCLSVLSARDAVVLLTGYLAVLLLIPSRYVVAPVGAIGTPAVMLSYVAGIWWLTTRFSPELMPSTGRQPVRTAVFVYLGAMLAAYAAGYGRPLFGDEASGANRKLILLVGLCGVALLAADGITEPARLDKLMRRLVFLVAAVSVVGLLQSVLNLDIAPSLTLPGLSLHGELQEITARGAAARVRGTSNHAIEFGVILAAAMPIALHVAFAARERRSRILSWTAVGLIGAAIPMSISRSALLGLIVGGLLLFPAFTWKRRLQIAALGVAALALFAVAVPGVIASYKSLILNVSEDSSIEGRTEDYEVVEELVPEAPVIGRGLGTYVPRRYTFLDNEYLGLLIETGFVGLGTFLALLAVGGYCALRAARSYRLAGDSGSQTLAQATFASLGSMAVTFAMFDGLGFPQAAGLLFVLIGLAGALWRLSQHAGREGNGSGAVTRLELLPADETASPLVQGHPHRAAPTSRLPDPHAGGV